MDASMLGLVCMLLMDESVTGGILLMLVLHIHVLELLSI